MKITNHKLVGDRIKFIESPNTTGPFKEGNLDTIVIHYTAGRNAESSIKTLTDPNVKASAHLVIGRDDSITQLVPFNIIAWHAGKSSYAGREGYNKYSIGIEIDNAGVLTKNGDVYASWFGRKYDENDVFRGIHRNETEPKYWHSYTEKQITTVDDVCRILVQEYNITNILGHEDISRHRKIDPGPAFPLDKLRENIFYANRDQDDDEVEVEEYPANGFISANKLNIRSGPSISNRPISKPLLRDKKVKVLEKVNNWYRVSVELQGWVSSDFVDLE